ncbi:MAG: RNA 2',3'-cyclic phosphodiesterase [Planctomycetota bacterium]|jgi:2'-5' RNA ligase|nr:RNA 2',3'-cyclic phosphodiesterase [Planctomycetota bacterium]
MNHFLAIRPDGATRDRLAAIAERLQRWGLNARWVDPEDYHITICFLGHIDAAELRSVPWSVADVGSALCPPDLRLPGLGAFGGRREPKTVYAAVDDPGGWCMDLHLDVHDALGMRPEHHFHPHITLCRPSGRGDGDDAWPRLLEAHGLAEWGSCVAQELCLLASDPLGDGRRYRTLERWPIGRYDARSA